MDTIAFLVDRTRNWERLQQLLGEHFRVIRVDAEQVVQGDADLYLVDAKWLEHHLAAGQERRQADIELRESMHKYRALFEQSVDGIFLHDLGGAILDVNRAAATQLGFTREELLDMSVFDLLPEKFDRQDIAAQWRAWDRDRPVIVEGQHIKKGGELLAVEITTGRVSIGDRDLMLAIVRDITRRKQLEDEREKLRGQLMHAQKMESVGRLAGGVAHDLNNLLSPVLGYGELLREELAGDPARVEKVDEILRAGSRARDLVRQLLAFSRKQTLNLQPTDISQVVIDFETLLRRTIPEDIDIEIVPAPGLPPAMADVGQVEQVIMNLAVNAADAMPDGGRLCLETSLAELDEQYAAARPGVETGRYVLLTVTDTGCGMDAQTRERIYEPFYSTKGDRGTGLGLATVYGIVKQHGGHIWVYSEPGQGTAFKIYLPVTEQRAAEQALEGATEKDPRGSETILLVEDNDQVRQLAEAILNRYGYSVTRASNGAEMLAAAAALEQPAHMLLTDVVLPGMNGRELYHRLLELYPDLKVLYMSGYTQNVIAHRGALDEGVQFIQKPFAVAALASKIREVLDS